MRIQLEIGRFDQHECGRLLTGDPHGSYLDNHLENMVRFWSAGKDR